MKKVALVFVLAVFVPSLVLAWLAIRSLRDQQFVLERQQLLLYQTVTDAFAQEINDYLATQQSEFNAVVESLLAGTNAIQAAAGFDDQLRRRWPLAEVGFCVTLSGNLLCPSPASRPEARLFCADNGGFLINRESVEVYWNDLSKGNNLANKAVQQSDVVQAPASNHVPDSAAEHEDAQAPAYLNAGKFQTRKVNPTQQGGQAAPGNTLGKEQNYSKVVAAEAEFRQLVGDTTDGTLARFLQNKLKLMFWHRLERDPQLVFGAQLDLSQVASKLRQLVPRQIRPRSEFVGGRSTINNIVESLSEAPSSTLSDEICLVVLDDNAKPVAISDESLEKYFLLGTQGLRLREPSESFRRVFKTDIKNPFVATEIGEALPHWEVAAYLRNPDKLKQSARTVQLTLGLLIAVLVLAIGVGSWLIVVDLKRQLTLARQKTDFVSNVSHELKTPLTSIRMFSELLADGRVADKAKQRSYLNIVTAETARLTRLINNVLDFSRMERGEKKYSFEKCDLAGLVRETVESYRPHLEQNGFTLECDLPESPLLVSGDRDALAQVIVNLLSNAEKYSGHRKEVRVEARRRDQPLPHVEVRVLDRGLGVPPGSEEKIFEQFYRAHDSLSSGIQGSGLGLTLARQISRAHGGDVVHEPREGGGSCFALRLPVNPV